MVSHSSTSVINGKVYPKEHTSSSSSSSSLSSSSSHMISNQRETYTLWMKSLVCHTYGCTAFDSKGRVVFRVENYDNKSSNEVHLMDLAGRVLCTVRRKRFRVFGGWEGYRYCSRNKETKWFKVKRYCRLVLGDLACQVTFVGSNAKHYIVRSASLTKSAFKVVNIGGDIVAEVKPKQSFLGVPLGQDVLSLVVEPNGDPSLVMALVIVNGLINHKL